MIKWEQGKLVNRNGTTAPTNNTTKYVVALVDAAIFNMMKGK